MKVSQLKTRFEFKWVDIDGISPLRSLYIYHPELFLCPDPEKKKRAQMEKLEREDKIICQLAQEQYLRARWRFRAKAFFQGKSGPSSETELQEAPGRATLYHRIERWQDDIFSCLIEKVWKEGIVTVQTVFAARVLLDILQVCGESFHGQAVMERQGQRIQEVFGFPDMEGNPLRNRYGIE